MARRLLLIITASLIGCLSSASPLFAAPDNNGNTITDRMENNDTTSESTLESEGTTDSSDTGSTVENGENIGINVEQMKENADNFSLDRAIENVQDMSMNLLIVWVIAAGILLFFKARWAMGLLFLGFLGFAIINYHETVVSLLMGVADWIAETLQSS